MNKTETKPTREELLQKLRNKKKQVEIHRMTKKNRENTLEKLESKAKLEQEEMLKQLKQCTPEQLKAYGFNDEMISQILKKDDNIQTSQQSQVNSVINIEENKLEDPINQNSKSDLDNIFDIPNIVIPKMSAPINGQIVNTI